jgi:hypothetical protein
VGFPGQNVTVPNQIVNSPSHIVTGLNENVTVPGRIVTFPSLYVSVYSDVEEKRDRQRKYLNHFDALSKKALRVIFYKGKKPGQAKKFNR